MESSTDDGSWIRDEMISADFGDLRLNNWSACGSLKPWLTFDYDRIVVQLPEHPYELQFKAVA